MPRPRARPLFEFGDYWIAEEPGRPGLYCYRKDAALGRTRRISLGTKDIERAKAKLQELIAQGVSTPTNDYVASVLEKYFEERTDGKPSEKQTRNAGKIFLKCWDSNLRASELDEKRQKEFAEWCIAKSFRLSYAARNTGVLAAAIRHAGVSAPKIVTSENIMRERWNLNDPPPTQRFIPTDKELGRLLSAPMPERLFRWIIVQMATAGRPQTGVDLSPTMRVREARLVSLNPVNRRQNKKYRATIRECKTLRGWLDKWEKDGLDSYGGFYCGYATIEGVKTALQALRNRKGVNLPKLSTYSFRHKVTSVLRAARVPEDQISQMLGHRRFHLRTTAGYGEWDPAYLKEAAAALDAWFQRVQKHSSRALFSHGNPTRGLARKPAKP
jgi:integrase